MLGVENLKIMTATIRKVSQVNVIFHKDKLLNKMVPTGSDEVDKKDKKLFVCAKVLAGSLLSNRELILGLTFPTR